MAECQGDDTSGTRRKGTAGKRAVPVPPAQEGYVPLGTSTTTTPCGACKFLRRKCITGCIFAPYFGPDQGAARFAAVHRIFGASNVSKLLLHIPVNRRHDAVVTISYEAQARLSDPVYGCVFTILDLQQQVASVQAELAMLQTQLINTRYAFANALQSTQQQQQQPNPNISSMLHQARSNNASASNNLIHMSSFTPSFDLSMKTALSSQSLEPLQISRLSQDVEEEDEESRIPHVFNNKILHRR